MDEVYSSTIFMQYNSHHLPQETASTDCRVETSLIFTSLTYIHSAHNFPCLCSVNKTMSN